VHERLAPDGDETIVCGKQPTDMGISRRRRRELRPAASVAKPDRRLALLALTHAADGQGAESRRRHGSNPAPRRGGRQEDGTSRPPLESVGRLPDGRLFAALCIFGAAKAEETVPGGHDGEDEGVAQIAL
jgi:hypothetical protein